MSDELKERNILKLILMVRLACATLDVGHPIRAKKFEKLIQHEVYGASYTTRKNNGTSNAILADIYTRRSYAFYRFVVVGRANCLAAPANLQRLFNDRGNENCTR
jgi:hypothetical protein